MKHSFVRHAECMNGFSTMPFIADTDCVLMPCDDSVRLGKPSSSR